MYFEWKQTHKNNETTDHADVKNIRTNNNHRSTCVPAVPMATRIDIVAKVFASWRTFLGPDVSLDAQQTNDVVCTFDPS